MISPLIASTSPGSALHRAQLDFVFEPSHLLMQSWWKRCAHDVLVIRLVFRCSRQIGHLSSVGSLVVNVGSCLFFIICGGTCRISCNTSSTCLDFASMSTNSSWSVMILILMMGRSMTAFTDIMYSIYIQRQHNTHNDPHTPTPTLYLEPVPQFDVK